MKAAQVWQMQNKEWSNRTYWLVWARNVATGEEKYFLSNAPADVRLQTLVRVAFRRWNVEKAQADYPSRRRWVGAWRIGYHRCDGVARTGRVVPATPGRPHRRSRMSDPTRRPAARA